MSTLSLFFHPDLTRYLCKVPREAPSAPTADGEAPAANAKESAGPGPAVFSDNEYTGRCLVHLDAYCWVQRDSYLPQVSVGEDGYGGVLGV